MSLDMEVKGLVNDILKLLPIGSKVTVEEAKGPTCEYFDRFEWVDVTDRLPKPGKPIEMTGDSGYISPHHRVVVSGRYSKDYADPWRNWAGDGLEDYGIKPTHWRYLTPDPPKTMKQLYKIGDLLELESGVRLYVSKVTTNEFKDFIYTLSAQVGGVTAINLMQADKAIVGIVAEKSPRR